MSGIVDTYVLYDYYGQPVYYGITYDPDRRISEHQRAGKNLFVGKFMDQ